MYSKLFISVLLLLASVKAQAQNQAYVYKDSVLTKAIGYVAQKASLDSIQKVYTQEVTAARSKAQENYAALAKPYNVQEGETIEQLKARMSAIDAEKLSLLQEEDKLLETRIKSYNSQLEKQYNRDIKPIMETIDLQIANYAKKHKIDYVFIMEEMAKSLAYVNKGKDITAVIVEMVNKELQK